MIMFNDEILQEVAPKPFKVKYNRVHMNEIILDKNYGDSFWINDVLDILGKGNYIASKFRQKNLGVFIDLKNSQPTDNSVISFLECVVYYFIDHLNLKVKINHNFDRKIQTNDSRHTPLLFLRKDKPDFESFKIEFLKSNSYMQKFDRGSGLLFHKIVSWEEYNKSKKVTSALSQDLYILFGNNTDLGWEKASLLTETITELVENSLEHAEADCVLTIDITNPNYHFMDDNSKSLFGLNISLINFSKVKFSDKVKSRMNSSLEGLSEDSKNKYELIRQAHKVHEVQFSDTYGENSFATLASLQHGITGRVGAQSTGGTGLTTLVKNLQLFAEKDGCYIFSGDCGFIFKKELLGYGKNGLVGLNEDNDFMNNIPDKNILLGSKSEKIEFPGTLYNLAFVFESLREENNG